MRDCVYPLPVDIKERGLNCSLINHKYNFFVISMDKTTFEYINNLVVAGEYRINQTKGVLETKTGSPVLWNGHSIKVCESAVNLSADEFNEASQTLTQYRAFTAKNVKQIKASSAAADNNSGLDKERVAVLLDQWVEKSEAYLKKNYQKAEAVVAEIDHEFDGERWPLRQQLESATIAYSRRRSAVKQRIEAKAKYQSQVKANQAIKQMFWQLDTQRFKNEDEVLSAIKSVAADYHREQQNRLMAEVVQLSELLVREANASNKVLVFPGRSLIACAAYIEKKYPEISVIKIPISSVGEYGRLARAGLESDHVIPLARALSSDEVKVIKDALEEGQEIPEQIENLLIKPEFEDGESFKYSPEEVRRNCAQYLDSYLGKSKGHELLLVDYVITGNGLKNFADMVSDYRGNYDGLSTLAVCGNSTNKNEDQLDEFKTMLDKNQFTMGTACFAGDGLSVNSPLVMELTFSSFDGLSPYGKQTIGNIVRSIKVTGNEPEYFAGFNEIGREAAGLTPPEADEQPVWKMI